MKTHVSLVVLGAACGLHFVGGDARGEIEGESFAKPPPLIESDTESAGAILRDHCLRCHNDTRRAGGLSFVSRNDAGQGGHSGLAILAQDKQSELLQRVQSTSPKYRMPKDANPLSTEQIAVLERWIQQGSPWPSGASWDKVVSSEASNSSEAIADSDALIVGWPTSASLKPLWLPLALSLLIVFIIERQKRLIRKADGAALQRNFVGWMAIRARWAHYVIVGLCFVIAAILLHHQSESLKLVDQLRRCKNTAARQRLQEEHVGDPSSLKPYRPHHPRRLGGVYYRGNDERDERLFNGGNYRTARFLLDLVDDQENVLQWGMHVAQGPLKIRLVIERSPQTTSELFRDSILEATALFPDGLKESTDDGAKPPEFFRTLVSGDRWQAVSTIGNTKGQGIENFAGSFRVGSTASDSHYGIEFAVAMTDGRLDFESELWMGPMVEPGRIIIPKPGTIPVSEWFDFLPIPEIEGANTDDPTLLGIPEHASKMKAIETN